MMLVPLVVALAARGESFSRAAALRNIAEKVIAPGYQDFAMQSRALTNAVEQLANAPDPKSIEQARQAWSATLLAARRLQGFQAGPLTEREYASSFYYWQVLPVRIEAVAESARAIDKRMIDELGATAKGLFALEYLLFDGAAGEPGGDVLKLLAASDRRRAYMAALARDIEMKASRLADDWSRTDAQGASAKFVAAGQETVNVLVNQLAMNIETVAENRMNFVLSLPQPVSRQFHRIEGSRSGTSLDGILATMEGIRTIYKGRDGAGLDDAVRKVNPALQQRLEQQMDAAIAALRDLKIPLERAVVEKRDALESAYQAVRVLEISFKTELASALGVTITFNSGDGD